MQKFLTYFILPMIFIPIQSFGFGQPNPNAGSDFRADPYLGTVRSQQGYVSPSMVQRRMRQYLGASCERSNDSYRCMLCNCMRESAGEPLQGKEMVGLVVKSRVESPNWPNTICGVIYQYKQFSWTIHKRDRRSLPRTPNKSFEECTMATEKTINAPGNGVDHYHATYVSPRWARTCTRVQKIGLHIFYKDCGGSSGSARRPRVNRNSKSKGQR